MHAHTRACMQLTASEEDVWRAVLAWGHSKAGVQGSVKQWTDTDRAKMKQVLNVSTQHIILIIIHSSSHNSTAELQSIAPGLIRVNVYHPWRLTSVLHMYNTLWIVQ